MHRLNRAMLFAVMVSMVTALACGGGEEAVEEAVEVVEEAPVDPRAVAAAARLAESFSEGIELVPTQRGQAEIAYTQPTAQRVSGFAVTRMRVKNVSENAIAGFTIDEFWFDGEGNTVTGDQARRRLPILVDEVCDVELRVPLVSGMNRSNYEFSHQNGDIKTTLTDDIEDPPVPEVEEGAEGEEAAAEGEEGESEEEEEEDDGFTCLRPATV